MLIEQERQLLVNQPDMNVRIFACELSNMLRISPEVISHKLEIYPKSKPIRQKVRRLNSDRKQIVQLEISRLLDVGFIWEVYYLDWLVNVVVVPKKGDKWRVWLTLMTWMRHAQKIFSLYHTLIKLLMPLRGIKCCKKMGANGGFDWL